MRAGQNEAAFSMQGRKLTVVAVRSQRAGSQKSINFQPDNGIRCGWGFASASVSSPSSGSAGGCCRCRLLRYAKRTGKKPSKWSVRNHPNLNNYKPKAHSLVRQQTCAMSARLAVRSRLAWPDLGRCNSPHIACLWSCQLTRVSLDGLLALELCPERVGATGY